MLPSLLEPAKVKLFQTTDASPNFETITTKYKILGYKMKKNYMSRNEIFLTVLVPEKVSSQHEEENAVC
jgi:hypothetical protein